MTDRLQMVERKASLSVRCQCNLVSVNRGSFYYQPVGEAEENLRIMRLMDEHYLKHPTEGVIRMRDFLMTLGTIANHKRVRRLLRLMGLMAIYPKKNLSRLGQAKYIKPYLLKGLSIDHPNHVWAIDITYSVPGSLRDFIAVTRAHLKYALLQLCLVVQAYEPERQ